MTNSLCSIDVIRQAYPHLSLALYAYEPGLNVTLEVIASSGDSFTFAAPTAGEAAILAFPELFTETAPAEAPVGAPTDLFD